MFKLMENSDIVLKSSNKPTLFYSNYNSFSLFITDYISYSKGNYFITNIIKIKNGYIVGLGL